MAKTVSQRSSHQLFFWGLLLLLFAYLSNGILSALIYGQGTIVEQLTAPSYQHLAERLLFSTFILGGIYLGMHFLAKSARRERLLQQRTKDLANAKQELEFLDESASRCLRDTAAELTNAMTLLKTQSGGQDDEKLCFLLQGVSNASEKLDLQLGIFAALTLSPSGELYREPTRLDRVAEDVITELSDQWTGHQVKFEVQPWLNTWCDRRLMRQVLLELFSNALDLLPHDKPGLIEFGRFYRNEQAIYYVRDNSQRFSVQQAEILFEPFPDTLQTADLTVKTLKLVRAGQLIRRHGGKVWAEVLPETSCTIYFADYSR